MQVKQAHLYQSILECTKQLGYPVEQACKILKISRSAYYKWLNGSKFARETENIQIADIAEQIHNESPDKGYRRIRDDLERYHDIKISDKRMLRICLS